MSKLLLNAKLFDHFVPMCKVFVLLEYYLPFLICLKAESSMERPFHIVISFSKTFLVSPGKMSGVTPRVHNVLCLHQSITPNSNHKTVKCLPYFQPVKSTLHGSSPDFYNSVLR